MLLLLLMVQVFCQLIICLVLMRYQDTVRDENIDIQRTEKDFNQTGWYTALGNFH